MSAVEFKTEKPEISLTMDGRGKATFLCPKSKLQALDGLKTGEYVLELKRYRERRSKDANAYFWKLVGEIAEVLKTDNDSVYLMLLERYGVFTYIVVQPRIVDKIKSEWRLVKELGEITVNGKKGVQLQCFFGSSTYDSKEMSRLIEGTVSEAKELGIDTRTPEEIALMTEEWGNEKHTAKG